MTAEKVSTNVRLFRGRQPFLDFALPLQCSSPGEPARLTQQPNVVIKTPQGSQAVLTARQEETNCYESTLRIYTEADFPMDYGGSHMSLGNVYAVLGNTERAREHFLLAEQGYAAAGLPPEWEWREYAERRLREL